MSSDKTLKTYPSVEKHDFIFQDKIVVGDMIHWMNDHLENKDGEEFEEQCGSKPQVVIEKID